jgi:hypothetical protein
MQAVVERVMRAFAIKHPSDEKTETVRRNAAEFAAELLDNYRIQLAQRDRPCHTQLPHDLECLQLSDHAKPKPIENPPQRVRRRVIR